VDESQNQPPLKTSLTLSKKLLFSVGTLFGRVEGGAELAEELLLVVELRSGCGL
jgi:hypothetical protein